MDQPLKQTLLRFKLECRDDDAFIEHVNTLFAAGGTAVLQAVFQLLAGIDIPEQDCQSHWIRAIRHRGGLMDRLERNIDITTALSDYLQSQTGLLRHPRLIEATHYEDVIKMTIHDKLTGLFNRTYFDEAYSQQIALAHRYCHDLTLVFLDIDNFKDVNDTYGHLAGDEALRKIAEIIAQEKRDSDIAARYGGEEFILLLTYTDNASAFVFAERLRKRIENLQFRYQGQRVGLTVSGGIATFPLHSQDPQKLLQMADNAVYLAKGAGKNKIALFKEEKRRYLRIKIRQPVLAKELAFDAPETFSGMSRDICVGGILFENSVSLPLGALIIVKVPVNGADPIILIGNVVRVEAFAEGSFGIGMRTSFKKMDKIANAEIASMLHR